MNIKDTNPSGGCHVVILGAGASIAATIRDPEEHGLKLPSMNNLPDVVGLHGSSPQLLFLHGNVAVGYNKEHNMIL